MSDPRPIRTAIFVRAPSEAESSSRLSTCLQLAAHAGAPPPASKTFHYVERRGRELWLERERLRRDVRAGRVTLVVLTRIAELGAHGDEAQRELLWLYRRGASFLCVEDRIVEHRDFWSWLLKTVDYEMPAELRAALREERAKEHTGKRGRPRAISAAGATLVQSLRAKGWAISKIARFMECSRQAIRDTLERAAAASTPAAARRAVELEQLLEMQAQVRE